MKYIIRRTDEKYPFKWRMTNPEGIVIFRSLTFADQLEHLQYLCHARRTRLRQMLEPIRLASYLIAKKRT